MATTAPTSGDPNGDNALDIQSYTACHNTLGTSELLENILLHLPMRDLLLDQRVCKTWKACIDSSVKLQRGLFFKPAGNIIAHPRLQEGVVIMWSPKNLFVNPLLLDAFGSFNLARDILHLKSKPCSEDRFTRSDASWQKMLLTQPPYSSPDASSGILKAEKELSDDDSPGIAAIKAAIDPEIAMTVPERAQAILNALKEREEDFLGTLPLNIQHTIREALRDAEEQEEDYDLQQALLHMLQGIPNAQALGILLQLSKFILQWYYIHSAVVPVTLSSKLSALPAYESAEQLLGL
ncbi:hypothetical protein HII31_07873 [Pseudocercospora fuligena]|uniref:F-box domain-containing protein n=1 Tax=Pseudocercospora fuligena TaxID=685502 RepID=A0A8H6RGU0_9PEZI|nr:hypothetical protein HII31_07873 [Pseudocercospora fuligena]